MLNDKERKAVAEKAIRDAEVATILRERTWHVETRIGSESYSGDYIRFLDANGVNRPVENVIAELMFERDEWKRRAEQHGCDVVRGDVECG